MYKILSLILRQIAGRIKWALLSIVCYCIFSLFWY